MSMTDLLKNDCIFTFQTVAAASHRIKWIREHFGKDLELDEFTGHDTRRLRSKTIVKKGGLKEA